MASNEQFFFLVYRGPAEPAQRSSSASLIDNPVTSPGLVSARSAGDALDQSAEPEGQVADATARQETAAAAAERHRMGDGSVVDLPVSPITTSRCSTNLS